MTNTGYHPRQATVVGGAGSTQILPAEGQNRAPTAWAATTAYSVADEVTADDGHKLWCITAGTSGGTSPVYDSATGADVVDGTVTWRKIEEVRNKFFICNN